MLDAHLRESGEIAEEAPANEAHQRTDVHLCLGFAHMDAQISAETRQAGIHVADNLGEDLVKWLKNPVHKGARGV